MNDLDERLTRHLHRQSRLIDVGAPSMVHVTRRAAQRRNRRRAAVGIVGTAAVGVATIVGIQSLSRPSGKRIVPASPTATTETSGAGPVQHAQLVGSNLVWNRFEPDSAAAIAFSFNQVATDDGFYAWSTEPGRSSSASQMLYRSTDGVSWEPIVDSTGSVPSKLAGAGNRLYSYGTTSATAAGLATQPALRVSTDAINWRDLDLPLDLGDLSGLGPDVTAVVEPAAIATGDHGVMVVVDVRPRLSTGRMAQLGAFQGFTADGAAIGDPCSGATATTVVMAGAPSGPASGDTVSASTTPPATATTAPATTTTILQMVEKPAECPADSVPARTVSWSELGVDPAAAAVFARPAQVFLSTDGEHFVAAGALPAAAPGTRYVDTRAIATTDGFAVLRSSIGADGTMPSELLTSVDGSTWTATAVGAGSYGAPFGQLADGTIIIAGYFGVSPAVTLVRDGIVQTVALDTLLTAADGPLSSLQGFSAGAIGASGISLVGYVVEDVVRAAGQPSMSRDGVTLTLVDANGTLRFTDTTTGHDLPAPSPTLDAATGAVSYTVTATDGSTVRFDGADVDGLYPRNGVQPSRPVVLSSKDGVSWSRTDLNEISGFSDATPIGNITLYAKGGKVFVSTADVSLGTPGPDAPLPKTVVAVGTPAG